MDGYKEISFYGFVKEVHPRRSSMVSFKYIPQDSFSLCYFDTIYTYTDDFGDVDKDGLLERVFSYFSGGLKGDGGNYVMILESAHPCSFPDKLVWKDTIDWSYMIHYPVRYAPDLDGDGRDEIFVNRRGFLAKELLIYENYGNNKNRLVKKLIIPGLLFPPVSTFVFGDFDLDGKKEFVIGQPHGEIYVFECIEDDEYQLTSIFGVYGNACINNFGGKDVDGDGLPEFYITAYRYDEQKIPCLSLYMFESLGDNRYKEVLIDTTYQDPLYGGRSVIGDIDNDGKDEIIWNAGATKMIYEPVLNNKFILEGKVNDWRWLYSYTELAVADMDGDSKNELVISGGHYTGIFESSTTSVEEKEEIKDSPATIFYQKGWNPLSSFPGIKEILIYGVNGQLIKMGNKESLEELTPGIYMLRFLLKNGKEIVTKLIVLK